MMLRDEAEVALNDLISLANTAAETYRTAADVVRAHDGELAALFDEIGTDRQGMMAELGVQDRRIGDTPHGVDPDYTTMHDLFVRFKSMLAHDERRALIEECEAAEHALAERLVSALELDLPDATGDMLRRFQYDVTASLGRLAATKARL